MFRLNRKALQFGGVVCVLLLMQKGNAFDFKVGGPRGSWTVPSDPNAAIYNQWAEKNRFQIGDGLLFVYDANHDSVLHVTKDDYTNCNTGSPLEKFTDGHTVFRFNQSGSYYFTSGVADNCHKNEKLMVVVMANRSRHGSNETVPSPSPSPSPEMISPSPSPAPTGEPSPPPPAVPSPSPEPAAEEPPPSSPPKNGASSTVTSFLGAIAAFIGLSLVQAI